MVGRRKASSLAGSLGCVLGRSVALVAVACGAAVMVCAGVRGGGRSVPGGRERGVGGHMRNGARGALGGQKCELGSGTNSRRAGARRARHEKHIGTSCGRSSAGGGRCLARADLPPLCCRAGGYGAAGTDLSSWDTKGPALGRRPCGGAKARKQSSKADAALLQQ